MTLRDEVRAKALRTLRKGSDLGTPDGARCKRCQKLHRNGGEYCCSDCREAELVEVSDTKLRDLVLARDKGVCSACGEDCLKVRSMTHLFRELGGEVWQGHIEMLRIAGFHRAAVVSGRALWEAHHVLERVKGGANVLSNLTTLCIPCHAEETAALAKSRSSAAKPRRLR